MPTLDQADASSASSNAVWHDQAKHSVHPESQSTQFTLATSVETLAPEGQHPLENHAARARNCSDALSGFIQHICRLGPGFEIAIEGKLSCEGQRFDAVLYGAQVAMKLIDDGTGPLFVPENEWQRCILPGHTTDCVLPGKLARGDDIFTAHAPDKHGGSVIYRLWRYHDQTGKVYYAQGGICGSGPDNFDDVNKELNKAIFNNDLAFVVEYMKGEALMLGGLPEDGPIVNAVRLGRLDMLKVILPGIHACPNDQADSPQGKLPLIWAAELGNVKIFKLLLEYGAWTRGSTSSAVSAGKSPPLDVLSKNKKVQFSEIAALMPVYFAAAEKEFANIKFGEKIRHLSFRHEVIYRWLGLPVTEKKSNSLLNAIRKPKNVPVISPNVKPHHLELFAEWIKDEDLKNLALKNLELLNKKNNEGKTLPYILPALKDLSAKAGAESPSRPNTSTVNQTSTTSVSTSSPQLNNKAFVKQITSPPRPPSPTPSTFTTNTVSTSYSVAEMHQVKGIVHEKTQREIIAQFDDIFARDVPPARRAYYSSAKMAFITLMTRSEAGRRNVHGYEYKVDTKLTPGGGSALAAVNPVAATVESLLNTAIEGCRDIPGVGSMLSFVVDQLSARNVAILNEKISRVLDISGHNIDMAADTLARALTLVHLDELDRLGEDESIMQRLKTYFTQAKEYLYGTGTDETKTETLARLLATEHIVEIVLAMATHDYRLDKLIKQATAGARPYETDHLKIGAALSWHCVDKGHKPDISEQKLENVNVWGEYDNEVPRDVLLNALEEKRAQALRKKQDFKTHIHQINEDLEAVATILEKDIRDSQCSIKEMKNEVDQKHSEMEKKIEELQNNKRAIEQKVDELTKMVEKMNKTLEEKNS